MSRPRVNGLELTAAEAVVYRVAANRARLAYVRKHGGAAVDVAELRKYTTSEVHNGAGGTVCQTSGDWRSESARDIAARMVRDAGESWRAAHLAASESAAVRAGENALRKRLRQLAAAGESDAAARLEELTCRPVRKTAVRKTAATRKAVDAAPVAPVELEPAPVADVVDAARESGRLIVVPVGATVPAPVVTPAAAEAAPMTRAARKASNRELAARMRAAGVPITADTWEAAKRGELAGVSA